MLPPILRSLLRIFLSSPNNRIRRRRGRFPKPVPALLTLAFLGLIVFLSPLRDQNWSEIFGQPLSSRNSSGLGVSGVLIEDARRRDLKDPADVVTGVPADALPARVLSVHDGDSMRIRFQDKQGRPVSAARANLNPSRITAADVQALRKEQVNLRLCSIDAPEINQEHGILSRDLLRAEVEGREVYVRIREQDQYGRSVATVYLPDGTNINRWMVRQGLAWHYPQHSRDPAMVHLEEAARKDKLGVWASSRPLEPWKFRQKDKAVRGH
jgi:endonuclease YncB( thermonuclease family)